MTPFEYIAVLISFVLSLALTHVLAGTARMIQHGVRNSSALLAFWMAFTVYLVVDFWLSIWHLRELTSWSLPFILFLLVQVSFLYVVARLASPDGAGNEQVDMAAYFAASRRRMFEVLGAYMLLALIVNQVIPGFDDLRLKIFALSYSVLFFAASRIAKIEWQRLIAVVTIAFSVVYSSLYLSGI